MNFAVAYLSLLCIIRISLKAVASTNQNSNAGWSSLVARRAHNPKVVGSNPAPATTLKTTQNSVVFFSLNMHKFIKVNKAFCSGTLQISINLCLTD